MKIKKLINALFGAIFALSSLCVTNIKTMTTNPDEQYIGLEEPIGSASMSMGQEQTICPGQCKCKCPGKGKQKGKKKPSSKKKTSKKKKPSTSKKKKSSKGKPQSKKP